MSEEPNRSLVDDYLSQAILILEDKSLKKCHVSFPDTAKPMSAVVYNNQFYCYVRFFPTLEAAQRAARRSMSHGNQVLLTRIPKGLVLWVLEPEAYLIDRSLVP